MTVDLRKPLLRWVAGLGLLGGLCGLLFFRGLADRDLWSSHEARAAMDARSLLDGEAGAAPHLFDGRAELQKPPLYYWLVAGISWLRDGRLDEWSVRLPSTVSATACVLALFAFGTMVGRPQVGFFAGAILATAVHFTWLARIARIDMPLALTTTVASLGFYTSLRTGRVAGLVLAYLSIAAGLLLKGPIGAVLPAAVVVALLVVDGEWPAVWEWAAWLALLRRLGIWWGVPLAVGLALPWFVWADVETDGALFTEFVWHHNVERGLGGSTLRAHPVWFYGPQFVGDFLPWSPLVLAGFVYAWRSGSLRRDAEARFGLAWFVGVTTVLSCASFKRGDYLLPAYPGAALFLACTLQSVAEDLRGRISDFRWSIFRVVPVALVLGVLAYWTWRVGYSLPAEEPFRDYRAFAALVREHAPRPVEVVFFRTEAHPLAFRVGRPLAVLVSWKELRDRLSAPGEHWVVMPPKVVAECGTELSGVPLESIAANTDLSGGQHEHPLVLLRAVGDRVLLSRSEP